MDNFQLCLSLACIILLRLARREDAVLAVGPALSPALTIRIHFLDQLLDVETRYSIGDPHLQFVQQLIVCQDRFELRFDRLAQCSGQLFVAWTQICRDTDAGLCLALSEEMAPIVHEDPERQDSL